MQIGENMLSVGPKINSIQNYNKSFTANYNGVEWKPQTQEDSYDFSAEKDFWNEQKEVFDQLTDEKNIPSPIRKVMKVFSVLVSGVLGAMAMGWASRRSIDTMKKMSNHGKIKNFRIKTADKFKKYFDKIKTGKLAQKIKTSDFAKSEFAGKLKGIFSKVKTKYTALKSKINGEKAENIAVNTFGVSGGVTSGYAALNQVKAEEE